MVVAAWPMFCVSGVAELLAKFVLFTKSAPIVCVPAPKLLTGIAAWPKASTSGWAMPSMMNRTLPLGVPAPGDDELMVAVNVTGWP